MNLQILCRVRITEVRSRVMNRGLKRSSEGVELFIIDIISQTKFHNFNSNSEDKKDEIYTGLYLKTVDMEVYISLRSIQSGGRR